MAMATNMAENIQSLRGSKKQSRKVEVLSTTNFGEQRSEIFALTSIGKSYRNKKIEKPYKRFLISAINR